jgi:hypothetical protein
MDKKFYVQPETEVVELETVGFLASSIGGDDDTTLNGGDDNGEGGDNFDPGLY